MRIPHGLRKACCRRLAEAGCSSHEIIPVSGHENAERSGALHQSRELGTAREQRHGRPANGTKEGSELGKRDSKLANMAGTVSQSAIQAPVLQREKVGDGGVGG
jgi:hypothetical protein